MACGALWRGSSPQSASSPRPTDQHPFLSFPLLPLPRRKPLLDVVNCAGNKNRGVKRPNRRRFAAVACALLGQRVCGEVTRSIGCPIHYSKIHRMALVARVPHLPN